MYSEKYQWVRGEKAGQIEVYSSHDNEWVYFLGGSRIAVNLISDYMMDYNGHGLDLEITKQPVLSKHIPEVEKPAPVVNDPIKSLLKQSAKIDITLSYPLEVSIPVHSAYSLIKSSFETELDELITQMIFENLNKETLYKKIKANIKEQIVKFYKNGE